MQAGLSSKAWLRKAGHATCPFTMIVGRLFCNALEISSRLVPGFAQEQKNNLNGVHRPQQRMHLPKYMHIPYYLSYATVPAEAKRASVPMMEASTRAEVRLDRPMRDRYSRR